MVVGPKEVQKWRFGRFKVTDFFGRLEPTPLVAARGHSQKVNHPKVVSAIVRTLFILALNRHLRRRPYVVL
jgi:hypothetical protein